MAHSFSLDRPSTGRRRFSAGLLAGFAQLALQGCGGAGAATDSTTAATSPHGSNTAPPAPGSALGPAPTPAPDTASAAPLPPAIADYPAYAPHADTATLSMRVSASTTGTMPYICALLPLPGHLPSGSSFVSPDDSSLAVSVLARWPDGSASLAVAAGELTLTAGEQRNLRLNSSPASAGAPLGADRISMLLQSVVVDFGTFGRAQLSDFTQPARVWWANAQTICARYRLAAPNHATLEAVIDVHAFRRDRALVEVVVENSKMVTATPVAPMNASYDATVSINGEQVTTVSSTGAAEGVHTAFRAWYASHWVGGDPGVRAIQDMGSLQAHPLFYKCARPASVDLSTYASDVYVPWGAGRHRSSGMGGGGDHPSIGPLSRWDSHFLQSGDIYAARAVEANALAVLSFNINYRDTVTGLVPDAAQLVRKTQTSSEKNWPTTPRMADAMAWETAHHPAAGLMAFVVRPSPVFIEIAQKIVVWNATWSGGRGNLSGWSGRGLADNPTGIYGSAYQIRGRAWGLRSLVHATFLSPEGSAWRSGGQYWLDRNRVYLDAWRTDAKALLGFLWDQAPLSPVDAAPWHVGYQTKLWQHHYLTTELHKAASAQLLTGTAQAALSDLADWASLQPVRYINESTAGGWRLQAYDGNAGRNAQAIDSLATWSEQRAWFMLDAEPPASGPWLNEGSDVRRYSAATADNSAGAYYPSYFWSALVAGVERGVPGSRKAWETVTINITNLSDWLGGFAADPRWGASTRNT